MLTDMNLLPLQKQKEILARYRVRLAALCVVSLSVLALTALVLMVPAYVVVSNKEALAEAQIARAGRGYGEASSTQDLREIAKSIREKVSVLAPERSPSPSASAVIEDFLAHRTAGISVTALFFDMTASGATLSARGVAHDRQTLADFVDGVKSDPLFRTVELPASSFVQKANIDFVVTLHVASTTPLQNTRP